MEGDRGCYRGATSRSSSSRVKAGKGKVGGTYKTAALASASNHTVSGIRLTMRIGYSRERASRSQQQARLCLLPHSFVLRSKGLLHVNFDEEAFESDLKRTRQHLNDEVETIIRVSELVRCLDHDSKKVLWEEN